MKNLVGILFAVLVIYVIYFDLTVGTLPSSAVTQEEAVKTTIQKPTVDLPSFQATVKPGQTVISIVEHELGKSLPVSITDLINDFKILNPGKSPEKIQIGSTYHFPDYGKLR
ncbi:hypothetical protein [Neobacillus kokaensis]|uniref:LysM domain-containing protein n=1 Tax=Neobacillus kokaensis TaxID=2759023 RepID=A0ABQ3N038_9BACI|nr:hypothetical protein [Neobacillus kokaensis]GHH97012.1 hypothetical protein AM1BK_05550 [Neobacillus kokaensis]